MPSSDSGKRQTAPDGAGGSAPRATPALRWGVVGTGMIANKVAPMIRMANSAELTAVASRRLEHAERFAATHECDRAFDSWAGLLTTGAVDAVYLAVPTAAREEIGIAAACAGKHVLCEKPFASLGSLERIAATCREHRVGFMDGTHFTHHPRTAAIRRELEERVGRPTSLHSAFQVDNRDRGNIRYDPALEPLGAIGDLGWYSMRAAVEYLAAEADPASVDAYCRRDAGTGAVVSGSGVLCFDDGATSTWHCGFDAGALIMDLRITGPEGTISLDDFALDRSDGPAAYTFRRGALGEAGSSERCEVHAGKPAAALMFEAFAAMVRDGALLDRSIRASERTQRWLDAAWQKALQNEEG